MIPDMLCIPMGCLHCWKYRWPRNTATPHSPYLSADSKWDDTLQTRALTLNPGFLPQGFCYFLSPPCALSSLCSLSNLSLTSQLAAELSMARLNLLECLDCSCLTQHGSTEPIWLDSRISMAWLREAEIT